MWDETTKRQAARILSTPRYSYPCVGCGGRQWTLLDGFLSLSIQPEPVGLVIGGLGVPLLGLICNGCGAVRMVAALAVIPRLRGEVQHEAHSPEDLPGARSAAGNAESDS